MQIVSNIFGTFKKMLRGPGSILQGGIIINQLSSMDLKSKIGDLNKCWERGGMPTNVMDFNKCFVFLGGGIFQNIVRTREICLRDSVEGHAKLFYGLEKNVGGMEVMPKYNCMDLKKCWGGGVMPKYI